MTEGTSGPASQSGSGPGEQASRQEERKLVTLLFADLTGYTTLASSLDPEEVYSFVRPTIRALQGIVEDFGGSVPQILGDGFMAVFGVPTAHEDDAERAVRAAVALRDHIRHLNAGRTGFPFPDVHAGVHSGEVLVAGSDEPSGFAVIGDTVNMASRLADLAPGGRVFVSARTRDLTGHAIHYGGGRHRRVKGRAEPLMTFEALGPRTAVPRRRPPLKITELVGRDSALGRLADELLATRQAGRSRVLIVTGEAGLGKSRLAAEFRRRVGGSVFSGRSLPYGQRRPLAALADVVRDAAGIPEDASGPQTSSALDRLVRRASGRKGDPVLASGLHLLLGTEARDRGGVARGSVRSAALAARATLEGLARGGAVAVLLDDLHWAGPELVRFVEDAHRTPLPSPVLFVGLARPEFLEGRALPSFELEALDTNDVRELAMSYVGGSLPEGVLRRLAERASGNPLFLEESLRMLIEVGALERVGERWRTTGPDWLDRVPSTVRLLIAERLDGLPPDEKAVLQNASVAGDVTWDGLVEELWGSPAAGEVLERLTRRDMLRRRRRSLLRGAVEYEFKHALIREVAYASISRRARAAGHRHTADWLRSATRLQREEPVSVIAYHYEQAWVLGRSTTGPARDPMLARLAAEYLERWADQTLVYQARFAEVLYQRALRVAEEAGSAVDARLRAGLLIGRAEALVELGQHEDAVTEAISARRWASRSGEHRLTAGALLARGRAESDRGRRELARALLEKALALFVAVGDRRGQGWTLHRLSETWAQTDYGAGLEYLREARRLFVRSKDKWGQAVAAQDLAYLLSPIGGSEFRERYEEARRLTRNEADIRSRADLARTWGYYCFYTGRYREAIRSMREARPLAREAGHGYTEADAVLIEAAALGFVGPQSEAELLFREGIGLGAALGSDRIRAQALLAGARCALRAGSTARARRRLREATLILDRPQARVEMIERHLVAAGACLDRGAWNRVAEIATQVAAGAHESGWSLLEPHGPLLSGRALLGAGRSGEAIKELAQAAELSSSLDAGGLLALALAARDQAEILLGTGRRRSSVRGEHEPEVEAIRAENRGLIALREGAAREAADAFVEASMQWERVGLTVWLARALAMQGEALRRAGERRDSSSRFARSLRVLDALETPARCRPSVVSPLPPSGWG